MMLGVVARQYLAVTRVGHRLSRAEEQAHRKQRDEAMDRAGDGGGGRPDEEARREDNANREAIGQPPGDAEELEQRVGPEE